MKLVNPFLISAEIRWFFEGRMEDEARHWIEQEPKVSLPEERVDIYFVYPNSTKCGIKLREERLEVKALSRKEKRIHFLKGLNGEIELWEKFVINKLNFRVSSFDQKANNIVRVKKKRWRCLWKWTKGELSRYSSESAIVEGCQLELTSIEIDKKYFWSLGFESFSKTDHRILILEKALHLTSQFKELIQLNKKGIFKKAIAASYPEILHSI